MCSRSRSWPLAPPKIGRKTTSSRWFAAHIPYRNLARKDFDEIIAMLSDGIAARRGRYGAYLHRDQVNHRLHGRRGSRLAAITSGGAIPDNALYTVVAEPEGTVIGTVDEDFAVESLRGDIILLGNTSWRIRRVQSGSVSVEDAKGAPPNVPFWRGEAPSRTMELSQEVAHVREKISALTENAAPSDALMNSPQAAAAIQWLQDECGMDRPGAEQAVEYIVQGRAVLRAVPTQETVIAERFFDESGGMQLVIHAPFGGRINKAWGLALRKRFCRSFNFELQAAATDNGLNISLSDQHSFPLADVFHFLHGESVEPLLEQAVLASPIFTTRWRWVAGRALALLRFMGGKKVPPQIQRMRSDDLLAAVFPEAARLPGKYFRRYRDSRSSAGARNDERRAHRSHGRRGPEDRPRRYRVRQDSLHRRGYARAVAIFPRDSKRESLRLPG